MLIPCKEIAQQILDKVREQTVLLSEAPVFCDVVVGDDPASLSYVKAKNKKALEVGFKVINSHIPTSVTTTQVAQEILLLNSYPSMSGLIVQLPLPRHIDAQVVLDAVSPSLDVDGLGSEQRALLTTASTSAYVPPTAGAIWEVISFLSDRHQVALADMHFLIVGKGKLVGSPASQLLRNHAFNVEVSDLQNPLTREMAKKADCIILGAGMPKLLDSSYVREGQWVIDAGTSEDGSGGLVGDADPQISEIVELTPVPGGVGPITVAKLMENVLKSAQNKNKNNGHVSGLCSE